MWWLKANQSAYETELGTLANLPGHQTTNVGIGALIPNTLQVNEPVEFAEIAELDYVNFLGLKRTLSLSLEPLKDTDEDIYLWRVEARDSGLGDAIVGTFTLQLSRETDSSTTLDVWLGHSGSATLIELATDTVAVPMSGGPIEFSFAMQAHSIAVDGIPKYGVFWNAINTNTDLQVDQFPNVSVLTTPFENTLKSLETPRNLLDVSDAADPFQIYVSVGKVFSGSDRARVYNLDHAVGGTQDDRIIGNASANYLNGWDGNDLLKSKGGDDTLEGGAGDDRMIGAEGSEIFDGGVGNDWMSGLSGADLMFGNSGQDTIKGGRDNDSLYGGKDNDWLEGNLGNDLLMGQAGNDQLRGGGGNDSLHGGEGDDYLLGENGQDTLYGGAGDDVLIAGRSATQNDAQSDVFVYGPNAIDGGGYDRIRGFENGVDVIDLSAFGYTEFSSDILSRTTEKASGLKLDWGQGNVLFIEQLSLSQFDSSDVLF